MANGMRIDSTDFQDKLARVTGKELTSIEKKSLQAGAKVLKAGVKVNLLKKLPAATRRNPKYSDTLAAGLRSSIKELDDSTLIAKVHIMGTRKRGSGSFRLRFFELGTKRYRKDGGLYGINRGNKKDKNKRFYFFDEAVKQHEKSAAQQMSDTLDKQLDEAFNG